MTSSKNEATVSNSILTITKMNTDNKRYRITAEMEGVDIIPKNNRRLYFSHHSEQPIHVLLHYQQQS